MAKQSKSTELDIPYALITMVKADIMAYVITAIFVLFSSIILTYTDATPKFENIITTIGIIVSAFLAGYDTAKVENKNGYKWGAVGGAVYFITFLILGTLIGKLDCISIGTLILIALLVLFTGCIAGMISVNTNRQSYKRR
ncbi:MAG: TIGR04086 family membrane protein [Cellulosilyticum sp.]|nr:TIGR04086 family membrane protein [Cellulosilyticum sp.]